MTIQNINTDTIEKMETKDALLLVSSLLKKFNKASRVYVCNFISYADKKFEKMTIVEIAIQVFDNEKTQRRFVGKINRATDWNCSNGISFTEVNEDEFTDVLKFQKKFNEIV